MRVLFLHNNFPGQYRRIAEALAREPQMELAAVTLASNPQPAGIRRIDFTPGGGPVTGIHGATRTLEGAIRVGEAAYYQMKALAAEGFRPDIVCAHSRWGSSFFIKDIWPETKLLIYAEWFYAACGTDADYLPTNEPEDARRIRIRMKNAPILADLAQMDWGLTPTNWQRSTFPDLFRQRLTVLHDGIDTDLMCPDRAATVVAGGHVFRPGDPVVTFVVRGLEPYRGFPQFFEALGKAQRQHGGFHALIVGEDRIFYGAPRDDGRSHKEFAIETTDFDPARTHFLGRVDYQTFRRIIQVSAAHVYLTVPFVLSWSMLEAMSCGALVIGSDTEPVREAIRDGANGILTDFFDTDALAGRIVDAVSAPERFLPIRKAARDTVLERYAARYMLPAQRQLMVDVANGVLPPR
ncbi:MAG: glycosyltransferase [Hyphomicrobiales bacterium]